MTGRSMASLIEDKNGNFLVAFRWERRQFTRSLDTRDRRIAEIAVARVEETIMRLRRGWATLPAGAEPGTYIVSGGTRTAHAVVESEAAHNTPSVPVNLGRLFDLYVSELPTGKKESNTLLTERIHRKHLQRILGSETLVESIGLAEAQRYAAARSRETWSGRPISSDTIRKELKTLRYVWGWGHALGHVAAACPWQLKDLHLSKDRGREPFRTMEEIERRIKRGRLDVEEKERLWECLFLTGEEVRECLAYVKDNATAGFVYPMFVFCALTGARRSELCRSRIDDFDFEHRVVHVRERKRDQSKRETMRAIDMHEMLASVMREWFERHPGGQYTLTQDDGNPVSVALATEHFSRTLDGSKKWRNVRSFHTFRHSFASILAMKGVDQRIIDAMMGHQTEEMRARYQHLFPKAKQRAIDSLLSP